VNGVEPGSERPVRRARAAAVVVAALVTTMGGGMGCRSILGINPGKPADGGADDLLGSPRDAMDATIADGGGGDLGAPGGAGQGGSGAGGEGVGGTAGGSAGAPGSGGGGSAGRAGTNGAGGSAGQAGAASGGVIGTAGRGAGGGGLGGGGAKGTSSGGAGGATVSTGGAMGPGGMPGMGGMMGTGGMPGTGGAPPDLFTGDCLACIRRDCPSLYAACQLDQACRTEAATWLTNGTPSSTFGACAEQSCNFCRRGTGPSVEILVPVQGDVLMVPEKGHIEVLMKVYNFTVRKPGFCDSSVVGPCGHIHVNLDGTNCTMTGTTWNQQIDTPDANGLFPATVDLSLCQTSVLNRTVKLTADLTNIGHALMSPPVQAAVDLTLRPLP